MRRDKLFKVGMFESGHEGGCPWGLIIKACVLSNLHGISLKVHSGGREICKSDAKSVLMLSIPQKQKTLNPLEIGSPMLLPNPTKDSLMSDKNTILLVLSYILMRLFVIAIASFLSSSVNS